MTKPLHNLKPPMPPEKINQLTDLGGWKLMMCRQVPFWHGSCSTPEGPVDAGSKECNKCRYNYDMDYIDGEEHD